jgi:hypothetical protein
MYAEAATITENASREQDETGSKSTRALLLSNTAVLWYKAHEWDRAERAAGRILSHGPETALGTARQVISACWQARTAADSNDYLTPIELRLSGGAIAYGLAPVEEVTSRQGTIQSLLWRISELEAGIPYRLRGKPGPEVRAISEVFAAAPLAGSYHIALRVRSPWMQPDLFPGDIRPEARVRGGELLVRRTIELASLIAGGSSEVAKQIADPLYRIGLSRLVGELAPDGKRVTDVMLSGGTARISAEFSKGVRAQILKVVQLAYEDAGFSEIEGELTGMELRDDELQIYVRDEGQDRRVTLVAPRGVGFEERVGPLWGRRVTVVATTEGKRAVLKEINAVVINSDESPPTDGDDSSGTRPRIPL